MSSDLRLESFRKPAALLAPESRTRALGDLAHGLGLDLRRARPGDVEAIVAFLERRMSPVQARLIGAYALYRLVRFGRPLLLWQGAEVVGQYLEENHGDRQRTSYCVNLAVAERFTGHRLAAALIARSAEIARARGCRVQRAMVSPRNAPSLYTFLNLSGFAVEAFHPRLAGYGEARFAICRPLDDESLGRAEIGRGRLQRFLAENEGERRLVDPADGAALEALHREGRFAIVALVSDGAAAKLLALPTERLSARWAPAEEGEA